MQEIADWLRKLDLGQYAQRFAENAIDVSVLRYLTDEDLKALGIPLGHRRKIRSHPPRSGVDQFARHRHCYSRAQGPGGARAPLRDGTIF